MHRPATTKRCALATDILRDGAAEIVATIDDLRGRGVPDDHVLIEAGQLFEALRQGLAILTASEGAS